MTSASLPLKHFGQLLKTLPKRVGGFTDLVFTPEGNLHVASPMGVAKIKLPVNLGITGTPLGVPVVTFLSAIDKRDSLSLTYSNNLFEINLPGYKASLNVKEIASFSTPTPVDAPPLKLSASDWALLKDVLPRLALDKIHPSQPDPNLTVARKNNRIFLGVQDKFQFSFTSIKSDLSNSDFVAQVPYPVACSLFAESYESSSVVRIGVGTSYQTVDLSGFTCELQLNWPSDDGAADPEVVLAKASYIKTLDGPSAGIKRAELQSALTNFRSIAVEDTRVTLSFKNSSLLLSAESTSGSIKEILPLESKVEEPFSFMMEHKLLSSIVSRIPTDFTLTFTDGLVKVSAGKLYYVSAVSV
jgi:hypothetical protein